MHGATIKIVIKHCLIYFQQECKQVWLFLSVNLATLQTTAHLAQNLRLGWPAKESRLDSGQGQEISFFSEASKQTPGPSQAPQRLHFETSESSQLKPNFYRSTLGQAQTTVTIRYINRREKIRSQIINLNLKTYFNTII